VKWVALIIILAAIMPLSRWLRRNPREGLKLWTLMGFLPFVVTDFHLYMAINSWAEWGGYLKGAEFSVLDALALAFYFSLPPARHPLPFRLSMALYFVAALLSVIHADQPMAALFYPWQLARMFLVYAVVTRACADPQVPLAILKGMAVALLIQAAVSIWERFALGVLQPGGTIGHQNLLGLISHLIVFPFFALLLAGLRGWLPLAVVVAGAVIEVLTTSRATIGLAGFGFASLFALSALRQWTFRKTMVLLMGAAMIALLVPLAISSFEQRKLGNDEVSSDEERSAYISAAEMMLSDHPFGVGPNHFALVANLGGYYDRAGVAADTGSRGGNVHNVYLLVAAETGYPGLITFSILLINSLFVAFRCGWRNRGDQRGDLLLGLGTGLLIVYLHSFFEWSLVIFQAQYMLVLTIGMIAGLAQQLGYRRPAQSRTGTFGSTDRVAVARASPLFPVSEGWDARRPLPVDTKNDREGNSRRLEQ
jgi:O-antigen ligase